MKKVLIAVIISITLIIAGAIVCSISLYQIGFDFKKLSTGTWSAKSFEVTEDFHSLSVRGVTEDVILSRSEDEKCHVDCYDHDKVIYDVHTENDTLLILIDDQSQWFEHIGFFMESPRITVSLPHDTYDSFRAELVTGDVSCSGIRFDGDLEFSAVTGDVLLRDSACRNLHSECGTGDLHLTRVVASGSMNIKRNTGDVYFDACDAASLVIETNTGDVEGTLCSGKDFSANTTTGSIDLPADTEGGTCQITTATGDIDIRITD